MVILLGLWLLGSLGGVGGGFIHRLLVFATIVLIFSLFNERRGTA